MILIYLYIANKLLLINFKPVSFIKFLYYKINKLVIN